MGKRRHIAIPQTRQAGDNPIADLADAWRADGVPVLLTLHQAAALAAVHYQTAWDAVQAGSLAAHKLGGRWRVLRLDLARWSLRGAREAMHALDD